MPKYRLLTKEELEHFEKEFVNYLVVNGIDAPSWDKIKKKDADKANEIIDLFSDVIFEKVLRQTSYLIQTVKNKKFCFLYGEKKAELMILEYLGTDDFNSNSSDELIKSISENAGLFRVEYQTKEYKETRELELFKMINSGCQIVEGHFFEAIKEYYTKQSN